MKLINFFNKLEFINMLLTIFDSQKICALNKKDLSEIKCFSVPPEGVKLVLEAIMTLKQADPSWAEAKRQLDDPNFLQQVIIIL